MYTFSYDLAWQKQEYFYHIIYDDLQFFTIYSSYYCLSSVWFAVVELTSVIIYDKISIDDKSFST